MAVTEELDGCGSHQPALRALARFTRIRSVIEFGAGVYSTQLFLDREAFPDLVSLVTFEQDKGWARDVNVEDERHALVIAPSSSFIQHSRQMRADFAFVDSAPHDQRPLVLKHALSLAPIAGMHDCRASELSRFAGAKYMKLFNDKIQTVFMSETTDLSGLELE